MTTFTQWFPPDTQPVHFGGYESTIGKLYDIAGRPHNFGAYWDGGLWRWRSNGEVCCFQDRSWRGLAVKPKSGISSK